MMHIMKVYFQELNKVKQIRRLAVSSDIVGNFDLLLWKIYELFPTLVNRQIEVTWRDPENDVIHMSSDDELAQAVANIRDGLLKIYVYVSDDSENNANDSTKIKTEAHNDLHPNVICDGCDQKIEGYRYKCLQCDDFDLCSECNVCDKHPNHDMVKLIKPTYIPREWAFRGSRKMWKSMFGRCSSSYYQSQQEKQQNPDCFSSTPRHTNGECGKLQWSKVLDDLLKGNFVQAGELLKENLENIMDFVEFVTGGAFVKKEKSPFEAEFSPKKSAPADVNNNTEQSSSFSAQRADIFPDKTNKTFEKYAAQTTAKVDMSSKTDAIKTVEMVDVTVPNMKYVKRNQFSQNSVPEGLFSYSDDAVNTEGWTMLGEHSTVPQKKNGFTAVGSGDTGAKPKASAIFTEIYETAKSCQTSIEDLSSRGEAEKATISNDPIRMTHGNFPLTMTQDPTLLNALLHMGFSKEGRLLEQLLSGINSNINGHPDSLN